VPLAIATTSLLGPDRDQFEILSGGGSFTLAPGESRAMTLRYTAKYLGRTSGSIGFEYGGAGSPAVVELFGRGIGGLVYAADDTAAAGERTSLALVLVPAGLSKKTVSGQRFAASLGFNQTLLAPVDPASPGMTSDGTRVVGVEGTWDGVGDTLAWVPMLALLGNAEQTSVDVLTFQWLDDSGEPTGIETDTRSGTFTLVGICREGTTRLYDERGVEAALKIAPNPVSGAAQAEYDLAEDGDISIDLFDAMGRRLQRIAGGPHRSGIYRVGIPIDALPSGAYMVILRTPTRVVSARIDIAK
jgi:hypothetical protein